MDKTQIKLIYILSIVIFVIGGYISFISLLNLSFDNKENFYSTFANFGIFFLTLGLALFTLSRNNDLSKKIGLFGNLKEVLILAILTLIIMVIGYYLLLIIKKV